MKNEQGRDCLVLNKVDTIITITFFLFLLLFFFFTIHIYFVDNVITYSFPFTSTLPDVPVEV